MTIFTNTWDSTLPADTEDIKLGASRIRNFKVDVVERLAVDHSFVLDENDGAHKKVTLLEQAADPGTIANTGYIYAKDVAGVTELFWYDSAGAIVQLTTAGVLKGPLDGNATTATSATTANTANTATDTASKTGTGSIYVTDTSPTITSPVLITPVIGTPSSGDLSNCTSNTEAVGNNSTQLATTAFCENGFVNNDAGYLGVGMMLYAFTNLPYPTTISPGAAVAGSSINMGYGSINDATRVWVVSGSAIPGTWRNIGTTTVGHTSNDSSGTSGVFQRIS